MKVIKTSKYEKLAQNIYHSLDPTVVQLIMGIFAKAIDGWGIAKRDEFRPGSLNYIIRLFQQRLKQGISMGIPQEIVDNLSSRISSIGEDPHGLINFLESESPKM